MKQVAVFLDRDGTIIEDTHYPNDPEKVVLVPNAVEGLKLMREKGYLLFVISNQSGVARGIIKDSDFKTVHERVCHLLAEANVQIEGFAYCFHHPDDHCFCRKPKTDLVPRSFKGYPLALKESFTVGDKLSDLELADNIGCRGCLVLSGKGRETETELKNSIKKSQYAIFSDLLSMAKSLPFLVLFLTLILPKILTAAEVLRVASDARTVAISHDITRKWQVNDRVCVLQNEQELDCGIVVKSKDNFSIVKLKIGSSQIARGDRVVSDTRVQKPAALIHPETLQTSNLGDNNSPFHLLSVGGSLGPGFLYPSLHFQRLVEPEISVGIMPSYLNIKSSNKTLSSISVLLTGNYYPKEFFKELFIQLALGLAFMSTSTGTVEQQQASFQSLLTAGYRVSTKFGIVLGFAAGIQYLQDPKFSGLNLNGVGLKPVIVLDAGVHF